MTTTTDIHQALKADDPAQLEQLTSTTPTEDIIDAAVAAHATACLRWLLFGGRPDGEEVTVLSFVYRGEHYVVND